MKHITFALLLLLGCWSSATAQHADERQRQLTMDDGLPSNVVRHIVQDNHGFIWMATEGGLCRYDGTGLRTLHIDSLGSTQQVTTLLADGPDRLIVGTTQGVYHFDFTTEAFTRLSQLPAATVSCLTYDLDSSLWVGTTTQGIARLSTGDDRPHYYEMKELGGRVSQVYVDHNNQVWAVSNWGCKGLWRLNKQRDQFELVAPEVPAALCLLQTSDGRHWIGTWEQGLLSWREGDDSPQPVSVRGPQHGLNHIHTLMQLNDRQLLIGSDDGLWTLDRTTYELQRYHITARFVYALALDREGGLWVGSQYGGVNYISPIAHRFSSTPGGIISRFCEDSQRRLWIASDDEGVHCLSASGMPVTLPCQQQLNHLNAHALCIDGEQLWIGTYDDGIYVLNLRSCQLRHHSGEGLPDDNCYALARDAEGTLWATTQTALCRYDRQQEAFVTVALLGARPIDLCPDTRGRLWVATQGDGVYCYDRTQGLTHYRHEAGNKTTLTNDDVHCLTLDEQGTLWVGTQGGLCRYDEKGDAFRRIRVNAPGRAVSAMVPEQGTLWLATNHGIVRFDPTGKVQAQHFTRQDGLVSEQFQPAASLITSNGRICFGTVSGFNWFYPYQVKTNQLPPPVFITRLEVLGRTIDVGGWQLPTSLPTIDHLDIWSQDRMFTLSFASLSYCSPEKNRYAYMLEGFDKQWNDAGSTPKATYTNLPTGKYIFRVKATNNDGLWSEQEARLRIVVHPPFWWSVPARFFYLVCIIGAIWLFLTYRLKRAERRHRQEMQALEEKKEREVREARMNFFTTIAHEIRTPVTLITGPLEKLREQVGALSQTAKPTASDDSKTAPDAITSTLDVIERNAQRLLELVNQLLDFRKVEQQNLSLHFAPHNVNQLLQEIANSFGPALTQEDKRFDVELPTKQLTATIDHEAITKVVTNLLSNARKYTRNYVALRSRQEDARLIIEVADNGMGVRAEDQERIFMPFYQAQDNKPGTGIGLSIVHSIVEQHHGTITVESQRGRGTTFVVSLPLTPPSSAPLSSTPGQQTAHLHTSSSASSHLPMMLIVDDSDDMLRFLASNFSERYQVIMATDGVEALDVLAHQDVTIIVSDWMMPRMDGAELCRRVRQNAATSHLPFVLLTARTDSDSKVKGMNVGADAYIEKPFSVRYLEATINHLLEQRRHLGDYPHLGKE